MVFDANAVRNPREDPLNDPISVRQNPTREGNFQLPNIIADNPQTPTGRRQRQLMRWRVPGLGFVDMYMNPQNLRISEKKVIQKQRTKGGYVIQYWGEELATISIDGTTGAAGIEGINILRKIYRAEQDSFQQVAQTLSDRLNAFTVGGSVGNAVSQAASGSLGQAIGGGIGSLLGNGANPPLLPTLASLATSVELFYQGWVFKGYFENFSVTESVAQGPGVFQYSMSFIVLDRRGQRTNFMPYHRSPADFDAAGTPSNYRKSNSSSTPMSFRGEE